MKAQLPGVFPERAFSTEYALKDLSYAIQMADERGVPALGADVARELMERAVELGHGKEYWPVLIKAIEEGSGGT
jgi:3-hydroxyisobutyrate dehydrogenase-like beta-hydroxyacid dehydrogenase